MYAPQLSARQIVPACSAVNVSGIPKKFLNAYGIPKNTKYASTIIGIPRIIYTNSFATALQNLFLTTLSKPKKRPIIQAKNRPYSARIIV